MKIAAPNQTLLLAREQIDADPRSTGSSAPAINIGSGNAVLERVTIVSARPDGIVYVRADFTPCGEAFDGSVVATVPKRPDPPASAVTGASTALAATAGSGGMVPLQTPVNAGRDRGLTSALKPTEHYARTQRMTDSGRAPGRIDVHA